MKFTLAALALPMLAAASGKWKDNNCLSDADAQSYVDRSIIFLQHLNIAEANATAQGLFADDIVEFGDSINALRGDPLGTQVEDGKARYIEDTLSTPPIASIETIDIIHDCDSISWYWFFEGIGSGQYRIQGNTLARVNADGLVGYQLVIFNSLSWGLDIGFQVTPAALPEESS